MKRLIFILIAMAVMIAPVGMEAQNQITRPSKKKTEQTSGNKPTKQSPAKKTNTSMSKAERDAILQRLINNMVYVEGGSFMMGSEDSDADSDEKPVHRETVGSFSIGKYEVSQKEWKAVMGNNPSRFKGDNLPVDYLTWDDCQKFIQKLNELTGRNFRLPTESEWEYAARGGNRSNGYKFSGSNKINNVAWYKDNSRNMTHNVGTKGSNELGLYDMSGNVDEWTSSNRSYSYNEDRNLSEHIIRGGSFDFPANFCRISARNSGDKFSCLNVGLRLVL